MKMNENCDSCNGYKDISCYDGLFREVINVVDFVFIGVVIG